jgi:hypothetical protein
VVWCIYNLAGFMTAVEPVRKATIHVAGGLSVHIPSQKHKFYAKSLETPFPWEFPENIAFWQSQRYVSNKMRSIRRNGSAAPHSNWSPTVKAEMYSGPIAILRMRPTGVSNLPVTAAGESCATELSF